MTTGNDQHLAEGYEYPSDPDADLPVPAVAPANPAAEQTTHHPSQYAPQAEAPVVFAPPVPPHTQHVAPPVAQPVMQQAYVGPTAPAVPQVVAVEQPAPYAAPLAPAVAAPDDVSSLLGFDPDQVAAAANEGPYQPDTHVAPMAPPMAAPPVAYVAPQPQRAPVAVPVADPRGLTTDLTDGGVLPTAPAGRPAGRPEIERLLVGLVASGGSDMHLNHGEVPRYRVSGALLDVAGESPMTTDAIERMLAEALPPAQWAQFKRPIEEGGCDLDVAYAMDEDAGAALTVRFRVNVFRTMEQTGAVFRVIPTTIVTLDELGVLPQIKTLAQKPRGLILFCGPTGSGKSTSMAGLVDEINETRTERIFTLEDPIEFTHRSKKSLISHREVGTDTASFLEGLKRVRRQDPDVILIGEMRDYETIGAAIEAADTGHLVIATLHTNSAPDTISRIINSFPAERQEQIRITLAETLLAVVCQVLVPSTTTQRGRVVAQEVMMVTPAIANNIRENDIPAIKNALTDRETGSISLDAHLVELIRSNKITRKEAIKKASSPEALMRQLGEA